MLLSERFSEIITQFFRDLAEEGDYVSIRESGDIKFDGEFDPKKLALRLARANQ